MKNKLSQEILFKISKNTLSITMFLGLLVILLFYKITIFGNEAFAAIFLSDPNSQVSRQIDFLLIIKAITLFGVFFYTIIKNYVNLSFNKETIKLYLPWYLGYFLITLASFILFFTYNPFFTIENVKNDHNLIYKIYYLTFIFIPLILLNASNYFYFYFSKKNKNKIRNHNLFSIIISIIGQIILFSIFVIFIFLLIEPEINIPRYKPVRILDEGKIYVFLKDLFSTKDFINIIYVVLIFFFLSFLIVMVNFPKIQLLLKKEYNKIFYKAESNIFISILFAIMLWFIFTLLELGNEKQVIEAPISYNFIAFTVHLLVLLFVSILYFIIFVFKKVFFKIPIAKNVYFMLSQLIIWISTFISQNYTFDNKINGIILLFSSIFSLIIIWVYHKINKEINLHIILNLTILLILIIFSLFIYGINGVLLKYNNYTLSSFDFNFSLNQIFILLIIISILLSLVTLMSTIFIHIIKLKWIKFKWNKRKGK
ncbi:MSC_0624 family F1-like ATPase-associated membrane protein [Mesomycoplasma molare]|uniref:Transmembrane protein n=1 Tax=Mesomycoplasma molare TaxID=171288 RepID=A0ABY5TV32_9BACT|nr:hypothetical protein [Mesomycoplasma molare]UWD33871.1 hypothetical protein NX772_02050 [Mesomycoplasma molare]